MTPAHERAVAVAVDRAFGASLQQLVIGCAQLATGYELCARRAREIRVADVGGSLSTLYRAVTHELAAFLVTSGASVPRTKPTCSERLRWEWLASTGRLIDGAPERQVLIECARIENAVAPYVAALGDRAVMLDLEGLRQVVTLLERAHAASARLAGRVRSPSGVLASG